jgi:hypothetical protein
LSLLDFDRHLALFFTHTPTPIVLRTLCIPLVALVGCKKAKN